MDKRLFSAALVLLLACNAAAWGPVASKHMCEESVEAVWGSEGLDCLEPDHPFMEEFCAEAGDVLGAEAKEKCMEAMESNATIHPATASPQIFDDPGNHKDYLHCPIVQGGSAAWICGDRISRPSYNTALKWFNAAEDAGSLCMRVHLFCVAGSYYADSQNTFQQVNFISNGCDDNIMDSIDRSIANNLTTYGSNQLCRFDNGVRGTNHRDYKQRMGESSETVSKIIANLTAAGMELKEKPISPKNGVVLLANSIDLRLAGEFIDYLESNRVPVIYANATSFQRLRYSSRIIVLGGQNAPEGVGEISSKLLTEEQELSLLAPGASGMMAKAGVWDTNQTVMLLAGNTAGDTARAWQNNRGRILELIA